MLPGRNDAPIGTRHVLDAGGDDDVVRAGHHALRGEVRRLLRRTALAVDRGADHRLGEAGRERRVATDVDGLVADLHDTAHDHVFDQRGVEVVAGDERPQRVRREVDGVHVLELPVALAERGADGVDDHGVLHDSSRGLDPKTRPAGQCGFPGRASLRAAADVTNDDQTVNRFTAPLCAAS